MQIIQRKLALQVIHRNLQGKLIWQARLGLAFQLLPSPALQLLDLLQAVTELLSAWVVAILDIDWSRI